MFDSDKAARTYYERLIGTDDDEIGVWGLVKVLLAGDTMEMSGEEDDCGLLLEYASELGYQF